MSTPDFAELTEPYRRELVVHCYRMLGSMHDAEDLVQETYLRAWRGLADFEGRSSVRTWLYRIATNACLNALDSRSRRAMPSELADASDSPHARLADRYADSTWIEPLPDSLLQPSPEAVMLERSSTRLAMIAALQTLSARERAAVILHDVVRLTSAEVAEAIDSTPAAVNSALQRARGRLVQAQPREDEITEPTDPVCRAALDAYIDAFVTADIPVLVSLLRQDVTLEMPPVPTWFAGIDNVVAFLGQHFRPPSPWRLVHTGANGQPAAAAYYANPAGVYEAHSLHLLTVTAGGIAGIVVFRKPDLFAGFGLPEVLTG